MTKAKYTYELVNQCMTIFCQDNILVENFELSDDNEFYGRTEEQFVSCLRFYDEMKELLDRNEINEAIMDHELKTVLALIRQRALERLLKDFEVFLKKTNIPDKDDQILLLKQEMQTKTIDAGYLLEKFTQLRKIEQNAHERHIL